MKDWTQVSLAQCATEPWTNSAGTTQVLLHWPTVKPWQLRLSVATIDRPSPYSQLPCVVRWHTLVQGALQLQMETESIALDASSAPFYFDGARPCHSTPRNDVATAFNVMHQGPLTVSVQRVSEDQS